MVDVSYPGGGDIAHDAPDSGDPLKVGGVASTGARSAVADGDRVDGHFDEYGKLGIFVGADGSTQSVAVGGWSADGLAASSLNLRVGAGGYLFNETTMDRVRGNVELTLLASAARTATVQSSDQTNFNHRGVIITVDVTAYPAAASVVLTVEIKDSIGGTYNVILTATAITATGQFVFVIYPSTLTAAAGGITQIVQNPLPRTWRINMTHADGDSITYSVDAAMIL